MMIQRLAACLLIASASFSLAFFYHKRPEISLHAEVKPSRVVFQESNHYETFLYFRFALNFPREEDKEVLISAFFMPEPDHQVLWWEKTFRLRSTGTLHGDFQKLIDLKDYPDGEYTVHIVLEEVLGKRLYELDRQALTFATERR